MDHKGRSTFIQENKEKFSKVFMVVAGYCARAKLKIFRVGKIVKVNAVYFQEKVTDPIFYQDIPRLYGDDSSKVWIHMDKASSLTARSSLRYYSRKANETAASMSYR